MEERMLDYQKDVDERSKIEFIKQINDYKKYQLKEIEKDERNRYRSLITAERHNLKKEYLAQTIKLKERHKHAMDAAERAQRELDRVGYEKNNNNKIFFSLHIFSDISQ